MSAVQAQARPLAQTAGQPLPQRTQSRRPAATPRLHVVRAPVHVRTRAPFVVTCMSLLAASLLGALLLNTSMAQGEYDRFALQTRLAHSAQAQQQLAEQLERAASPQEVATAAQALGMVPASGAAYLRLADGAVLGAPVPAPPPAPAEAEE